MKGLLPPTMLPMQENQHKEGQGIRDNRTKDPLSLGASQQAHPLRNLSLPLRHNSIPCVKLSFHPHPKGYHPSLIILQGNLPKHINYHYSCHLPQCMKLSLHHHKGSHPSMVFLLGNQLSNHILLGNPINPINSHISYLPLQTQVDFRLEFSNG